jgi:hypothetical protein
MKASLRQPLGAWRRLTLALLAVLALAASARAGSEQFIHRETGVALPVKIAGLVREEPKPYGPAGAEGVMMHFSDGEATATVYFRPIGESEVTSAAAVVENSLVAIRELEKRGMYSKVEVLPTVAEPAGSPWASTAFVAQMEGKGQVASFVYARIKEGFVIKLRLTTSNPKNEVVVKFVNEFRRRADSGSDKAKP